MVPSFRRDSFRGSRRAGLPAAAVIGEITDELIHVVKVGAVDHEAAFLAAASEAGTGEMSQVERKRRRGQLELLADPPGRQTLRTRLDKKPEDLQSGLVGEGGQRIDCLYHFHVSRIMELIGKSQAARSPTDYSRR